MVTLTKYCFLLSNQRVAGSGFRELASASGGQQRARTLSKLSGKRGKREKKDREKRKRKDKGEKKKPRSGLFLCGRLIGKVVRMKASADRASSLDL